MATVPHDPLERSAWYKARAAVCRRVADVAKLDAIRESYETMAKQNEDLAADAERDHRLQSGS